MQVFILVGNRTEARVAEAGIEWLLDETHDTISAVSPSLGSGP